jgi:hypothetical protein
MIADCGMRIADCGFKKKPGAPPRQRNIFFNPPSAVRHDEDAGAAPRPTSPPARQVSWLPLNPQSAIRNPQLLRAPRCRRGSAYVLVLSTALLLTVIGLAALTAARLGVRMNAAADDGVEAEILAESAVEYALHQVALDPNWRTTYKSGNETTPVPLGRGTISFRLVDETDGLLDNSGSDPVRIYGIGRAGIATRIYSVRACGQGPVTCLNAVMTTNASIDWWAGTIQATGMTIASNASMAFRLSTINANLEAVGAIDAWMAPINGTRKTGVPARDMPNAGVFDYYVARGTPIAIASLPLDGNGYSVIAKKLISPASNPFGLATNAEGIYVIDCQGRTLTVKDSRIVGTLVLINPGPSSRIGTPGSGDSARLNWAPAVSNYPCLLVKGDLILSFDSTKTLGESSLGTNFNPPGTPYPYPVGATNTTNSDTYPSEMAGLVYVSGNLTGDNWSPKVAMLFVGGGYDGRDHDLILNYDPTYLAKPPPGFTGSGQPMPIGGTWRWEQAP